MVWTQRRAKYGSKRTEYAGRTYDSMGEAGLAKELTLRLRAGEFTEVTPQVTFELRGPDGHLVCRHRVDFLVTYRDGSQRIFEYKGMANDVWRIKRELFISNYPGIPYEVVTARPGWRKRK